MSFICLKQDLENSLNLAVRHIGRNLNIPTLQGGFLEISKNKLTIQTTNLETGFKIWIPIKTEKEDKIVIPIKTLYDYISTINTEKINIEIKNNHFYILNQNSKTILKNYPLNEFPLFPKVEKKIEFSIPKEKLINSLKVVANSASKTEIRPELSSVYFFKKNNNFKITTTDSFRLGEKTIQSQDLPEFSFLLPYKYALELIKILENTHLNSNNHLKVFLDDAQILFEGENFQYISILSKAAFPDYEKNIPNSFINETRVNLKELLQILSSASVLSSRLNEVFMYLDPKNQTLEIKTTNNDLGEYSALLPAKIKGEPLSLTFNHQYLLDGINNIKSGEALFRFTGDLKPLLITSPDDPSYFYLLMPMKNY